MCPVEQQALGMNSNNSSTGEQDLDTSSKSEGPGHKKASETGDPGNITERKEGNRVHISVKNIL
jgi:hypothetical protein